MSTSLRFMLLGIALLLAHLALGQILSDFLTIYIIESFRASRLVLDLLYSIIPIIGIALVFIGFFKRDR